MTMSGYFRPVSGGISGLCVEPDDKSIWIVLRKAWIGRYPQFAQEQSMDCTSSRRGKSEAQAHRREPPGAAEILSRLCLFVNSENSQLAKWCGLYSLSPYRLWRSAYTR